MTAEKIDLREMLEKRIDRLQKYIDALIYINLDGVKDKVAYHQALKIIKGREPYVVGSLRRDWSREKAQERFIELYGEIKQIQDDYPDLKGW